MRACVQTGSPVYSRSVPCGGSTNAANGDASHPCVGDVAPRTAPRVVGADCAGLNLGRIALDTLGIDVQLVVLPPRKARAKHYFDIKSSQVPHGVMEHDDSARPCTRQATVSLLFMKWESGGLHDACCVVLLRRVLWPICANNRER